MSGGEKTMIKEEMVGREQETERQRKRERERENE